MSYFPVFIPAVDTPVLHELARKLASLKVGSYKTKATESSSEADPANNASQTDLRTSSSSSSSSSSSKPSLSIFNAKSYKVTASHLSPLLPEVPLPNEMRTYFEDEVGKDEETRDLKNSIWIPGKPLGKHIAKSFLNSEKDSFKAALLESKIIILDLLYSIEDADFIINFLTENAPKFVDNPKTIIVISTVMTWGRTKSDPDDPSTPLAEDEFRRRRPHPNFRHHIECEKLFIQLNKLQCYQCYVLFSGLVYHVGDCVFHSMLKRAWQGIEEIMVYGDGENYLPMIHLTDLCSTVFSLIENHPIDVKYILAVDDAKTTYADIARAISALIGSGKVTMLPSEQALLDKELNQTSRDLLSINLRFDPINIKKLNLKWKYESGFVDNLNKFVDEYKRGRGLTPLKIIVIGPPYSGKTSLALKLAQYYNLPYLDLQGLVQETIRHLSDRFTEQGDSHVRVDDPINAEGEKELLQELIELSNLNKQYPLNSLSTNVSSANSTTASTNNNYNSNVTTTAQMTNATNNTTTMNSNNSSEKGNLNLPTTPGVGDTVYPESHITSFLKAKLISMPCQNHGYVLDNYPTTSFEATHLLSKDMGDEGEAQLDPKLSPNFVINLKTPDTWIFDRAMRIPEHEQTPRTSEEGLTKRLEDYRAKTSDDQTVLNYFDEMEIVPHNVEVSNKPLDTLMDELIHLIGKPHNFGPSKEVIALRKKKMAEEAAKNAAALELEEARQKAESNESHAKAFAEWTAKLEEVKRQEQQVLEAQSLPLRHYLMKYVMPTLSQGLMEVCKLRPEDPVEYLAEFLFKKAPGVFPITSPAPSTIHPRTSSMKLPSTSVMQKSKKTMMMSQEEEERQQDERMVEKKMSPEMNLYMKSQKEIQLDEQQVMDFGVRKVEEEEKEGNVLNLQQQKIKMEEEEGGDVEKEEKSLGQTKMKSMIMDPLKKEIMADGKDEKEEEGKEKMKKKISMMKTEGMVVP